MYYKIANKLDFDCFKECLNKTRNIDKKQESDMINVILEHIENYVKLLCDNYGDRINSESTNGGFILFINSSDSVEILNKVYERYGVKEDYAEFEDVLFEDKALKWISRLYVVTTDYNIVIILPVTKYSTEYYIEL